MSTIVLFAGDEPLRLDAGNTGKYFRNDGPSTVYYGLIGTVTSLTAAGSIAPTGQHLLTGVVYLVLDSDADHAAIETSTAQFSTSPSSGALVLPWASGATYLQGQVVSNSGVPYIAVDAHTAGATFAGDSSHWQSLIGPTGPTGPASLQIDALRIGALGDSLSQHNYGPLGVNEYVNSRSWLWWAMLSSGGRLRWGGAWGGGGFTTAQILTTELPLMEKAIEKPDVCVVLPGMNDVTGGATLAPLMGDVGTILDRVQAMGCKPILGLLPGAYTAVAARLLEWNAGIAAIAAARSIEVLDFSEQLADANGVYLTNMHAGDQIHLSAEGAMVAGQMLFDTLDGRTGASIPRLAREDAEPGNLLDGGLFLTNSSPGPHPDGWTVNAAGTVTYSLVTDAEIEGNWLRIVKTTGTDTTNIGQSGISVSPGQRVKLTGRFRLNSLTGPGRVVVDVLTSFAEFLHDLDDRPGLAFWMDDGHNGALGTVTTPKEGVFELEGYMPDTASTSVGLRILVTDGPVDVQLAQLRLTVSDPQN